MSAPAKSVAAAIVAVLGVSYLAHHGGAFNMAAQQTSPTAGDTPSEIVKQERNSNVSCATNGLAGARSDRDGNVKTTFMRNSPADTDAFISGNEADARRIIRDCNHAIRVQAERQLSPGQTFTDRTGVYLAVR